MQIVHATSEDVRAIAQVHVLAWRAAYEGIVPDEHLVAQSVEKREAVWREAITKGTPEVLLARSQGQLVGWVAFGPSRDEDAVPHAGEIWAIYVDPPHWSQGVGRLLWRHARRRLVQDGYKSASVWVFAENTRAIRFYRAAGFAADPSGKKEVIVAGKRLQEVRYVATLDD